jgi:hypothetical protein
VVEKLWKMAKWVWWSGKNLNLYGFIRWMKAEGVSAIVKRQNYFAYNK